MGSNGVLLLVSSEWSLAIRTSSGSLTDSSYMLAIRCEMRSYLYGQWDVRWVENAVEILHACTYIAYQQQPT